MCWRAGFSGSFVPTTSGGYELLMETVSGAPLAGDTVRLPMPHGPRQRAPRGRAGARSGHGRSAEPAGAAGGGCARRLRHHRRGSREPAHQPPRNRGLRPARDPAAARRATGSRDPHLHPRSQSPRAVAWRYAPLLRGCHRQHTRTPGGSVAGIRDPASDHERGPRGAALGVGRHRGATRYRRRGEPSGSSVRPTISRGSDRVSEGTSQENGESLSFEQSKRAEGVAKSQDQLLRQAEELKQSIDELRRSAEAAGMADTAWQRQLQEIREQIDRALTPRSCGSGSPICSRRSRTSTPRPRRTRWNDWRRRRRNCGRPWSGAGSCSSAPHSRGISPTSPRNPGTSPGSSDSGTSRSPRPTAPMPRWRNVSSPSGRIRWPLP